MTRISSRDSHVTLNKIVSFIVSVWSFGDGDYGKLGKIPTILLDQNGFHDILFVLQVEEDLKAANHQ